MAGAQSNANVPNVESSRTKLIETFGKNAAHAGIRVPHLRECLYVVPSTVCNLKCRFCAYPKSSMDKRVMSNELFFDVIDKACDYGFTTFGLTPLLGEVLTDPHFLDKLEFLDRHPAVSSYSFCTNFTIANDAFIEGVQRLKKLRWLSISVYGHDEESFENITQSNRRLFLDLLQNVEKLGNWPSIADHVELRIRTAQSFEREQCHPLLRRLIEMLESKSVRIRIPHDQFANWGGIISPSDVEGLDIHLKPEQEKGDTPCAFLFYKHTVLPNGRLNACSAADGNATMIIGDVGRQSFHEIYSTANDAYMNLIRSHFGGRFGKACRHCTGYRSAENEHYSYAFHERPFLSLSEFVEELSC